MEVPSRTRMAATIERLENAAAKQGEGSPSKLEVQLGRPHRSGCEQEFNDQGIEVCVERNTK
jgi:hypothetical protein